MEMTIVQTGNSVTFTVSDDFLVDGTGTIAGDTLLLTAGTSTGDSFTSQLVFAGNRQRFAGPYQVTNASNEITTEGSLEGEKGGCAEYDIDANGIPAFIDHDFTQLSKIEQISRFRSGVGHSFTDGTEECRSMKHYFSPYEIYRENNTVEIYSPVTGTIISVPNDGHGASLGLNNKQIHVRPDAQPAFTIVLFHCDLISSAIQAGARVVAGQVLGYGRLYYEDLAEHADNFDIAVWVNTPSGARLVSYFDTMTDLVFNDYISRGAVSRQDFIITKEARDADPLSCDGETFLTSGNLENWVTLD